METEAPMTNVYEKNYMQYEIYEYSSWYYVVEVVQYVRLLCFIVAAFAMRLMLMKDTTTATTTKNS